MVREDRNAIGWKLRRFISHVTGSRRTNLELAKQLRLFFQFGRLEMEIDQLLEEMNEKRMHGIHNISMINEKYKVRRVRRLIAHQLGISQSLT